MKFFPHVPLLRSEDMSYVSITMTNDAAHRTITSIGDFGKFHFVDLSNAGKGENHAPSRQHVFYKKRLADCNYWEKKFVSFREEMQRRHVTVPFHDPDDREEIKCADIIEEISNFLDPIERELVLNAGFQKENQRQISDIIERMHVMRVCKDIRISDAVNSLQQEMNEMHGGQSRQSLLSDDDHALSYLDLTAHEQRSHGNYANGNSNGNGNDDRLRNFMAGVVPIDYIDQMKRMLYRISRGNAMANFSDIDEEIVDPNTGEKTRKAVFWIVFLGSQLNTRIRKMCDIIHATVHELPPSNEIPRTLDILSSELNDKTAIDARTEEGIITLLTRLAEEPGSYGAPSRSPLLDWEYALHKEKCVCTIFMKCHFYLTMIAVEGWVPSANVNELKEVVRSAVIGTGHPPAAIEVNPTAPLAPLESPPTYFILNKFTATFQGIVDTYGIPRYKEVNPGLFTVISFPFLYGVMYGDMGHGTITAFFALCLILKEKSIEQQRRMGQLGEIPSMAFGGRYILFCMGLFAIYCGIIYNDCFSLPTALYTSSWLPNNPNNTKEPDLWIKRPDSQPYPLGVDYNWYHKQNELAFFNGMKMKSSVILGVAQMTFGLVLSLCNHVYFEDYISIAFEFIPRLIFLLCTFGYMVFMIIYKWTINYCTEYYEPGVPTECTKISQAPNLIQTMINMFLSPGSLPDSVPELYPGQAMVQLALLLIAVFSIPVMLCVKPCVLHSRRKKLKASLLHNASDAPHEHYRAFEDQPVSPAARSADGLAKSPSGSNGSSGYNSDSDYSLNRVRSSSADDSDPVSVSAVNTPAAAVGGHGDEHEHSLSDELIHTAIHTIEYVLGCVSNTASYLRLWALSLAHAQLAKVFWDKMIIDYGIENDNPVFAFVGYAVWAGATFAVLLCMDSLECFLHALRLHWVEFQNKFYYADGRAFVPFTFKEVEE
jgi:V-type H+-transporting ATPase subunit a